METAVESTVTRARVRGTPGERPRLNGLLRTAWPVFAVVAAAGYLLRTALPHPALTVPQVGGLFLLLALVLAGALAYSRTRLSAFVKGARGEERTARELALLPAGYTVYHGLAADSRERLSPAADYDHVVVGPTGVFVIETKNWMAPVTIRDGAVLYDGQPPSRSPLEQVKRGVSALRAALGEVCGEPIDVHPVVCFAAGSLDADSPRGAAGVVLCNATCLNAAILEPGETTLTAATQARINAYLDTRVD